MQFHQKTHPPLTKFPVLVLDPPRSKKPVQSEHLSGFVDGDDEFGEYAGYGALDSGGEEDSVHGEAGAGVGCGDSCADGESAEVRHSNGAATRAAMAREGESEGSGGCAEGEDGGVVDPAHIEASIEPHHPRCCCCCL